MTAPSHACPLDPRSDGTSACPLITGDHSVTMVEFDCGRLPVSNDLRWHG